jgi:hypothetical protein
MNVQFEGRRLGREVSGPDLGEEVADQWSGQTMDELLFFMAQRVVEGWIFRFETDTGRASRAAWRAARPAVYQASDGAQVASPQSPILR